MNGIPTPKSLTINLICNGNKAQVIGIQSVLDGKKVLAVITRVSIGTPISSEGGEIATNQENVYLKLVNSNNQVLHDSLPLYLLDPKTNGTGQVLQLDSTVIDWTKSAILWGSAVECTANTGKTIPLLVIYG